MNIEISGYKSIEKCNLDITDNKINMIFGMSGSGKSSIASALSKKNIERNRTIGKNIPLVIKVNGSDESPRIAVYDKNTIDKYIYNKDSDDVYTVLIDDNQEIKKGERALANRIRDLQSAFQNEHKNYEVCSIIKKELGSELTKNSELRSNAKIIALEKSISKTNKKNLVEKIESISPKDFEWLKKGMSQEGFINLQTCPFCNRRIPNKKYAELNQINNFEQKTLNSIRNIQKYKSPLFDEISITRKGIGDLKAEVKSAIIALNNYEIIQETLSEIINYNSFNWNTKIELTDSLKNYFPNIYNAAKRVFSDMEKLKFLTNNAHNNTKRVLARRLDRINDYLEQMSIPYKMTADYANGKIKTYKIVHRMDKNNEDRPDALSEGEKSIVSLLMFIFQYKKTLTDLIVFDDPVSYYDDFRRSQILKIIEKELDHRTILILSHDNVFAKYALGDKYKRTDKIYYFENFNEASFKPITRNDIGDFNEFVYERINNSNDYYQKIINIRLLYEGMHNSHIYKYLSGIIHNKTKEELYNDLSKIKKSEGFLIGKIKKEHPKINKTIIPFYDEVYEVDLNKYSVLEKAFWIREHLNDGDINRNNVIDELNEFVHINGKLKVCLNPYEYSFCTKRLYEYLNSKG